MKRIILFSTLLLSSNLYARSFNEVRDEIFMSPLSELPAIEGISAAGVARAFFTHTGEIVRRSRATFIERDDFREPRPKLLHPRGVCTDATWKITEESQATGLFAKGTELPAIVRFSSGTSDSAYPTESGRIFGFAAKIFPTLDLDEDVETLNIQTLDTDGFDRTFRKRFFHEDDGQAVTFTNVAPAQSTFGKLLATFFDRFDLSNFVRPVYPLAQIDAHQQRVAEPKIPYEIHFVANFQARTDTVPADFRDDLMTHPGQLSLDIIIRSFEPEKRRRGRFAPIKNIDKKIGVLTLHDRVVSDSCDLKLHFHHPKNIRR
jgi:hypothetical protein